MVVINLEPSWLEPKLELKDFKLGSARIVTFLLQLGIENWLKNELRFQYSVEDLFFIIFNKEID